MSNEVEEAKTERKIAAKRHQQIIDTQNENFGKLAAALNKKPDDTISKSIIQHTEQIRLLGEAILNHSKPEPPNVNVDINQQEVVSSIVEVNKLVQLIFDGQKEILNELRIMNQPKETIFEIIKDQYRGIVSAKATTKYITPKAQA